MTVVFDIFADSSIVSGSSRLYVSGRNIVKKLTRIEKNPNVKTGNGSHINACKKQKIVINFAF